MRWVLSNDTIWAQKTQGIALKYPLQAIFGHFYPPTGKVSLGKVKVAKNCLRWTFGGFSLAPWGPHGIIGKPSPQAIFWAKNIFKIMKAAAQKDILRPFFQKFTQGSIFDFLGIFLAKIVALEGGFPMVCFSKF